MKSKSLNANPAESPKPRPIDYDKLAKESGEDAYQSAKDAGLGDDVASLFRHVFGTPIEPEYRTS